METLDDLMLLLDPRLCAFVEAVLTTKTFRRDFCPNMSDVSVLVEEDELEREKMNGMLINVAPLHGIENVGFESEVSENAPKVGASRQGTQRNDDEQTDFIMALFVVVFDTRHGK